MDVLKLAPAFKDYIWGGERLITDFGKRTALRPVAESWELSCHPDGLSTVAEGPLAGESLSDVLSEHPRFAGGRCRDLPEFPVIMKLIDARENLSVQVHPDDAYARSHEGQPGKNEMWYVVDALPGAALMIGCRAPASKEELLERIQAGTLPEIMRTVPVRAGDCFLIRAGTLHAIGAGTLVAEIQQSSNVTYRVFDFGRVGPDGTSRPLHIRQALDVADTALAVENRAHTAEKRTMEGHSITSLTDWPFFSTVMIDIHTHSQLCCGEESFQGLLVVEGAPVLRKGDSELPLRAGESVFVPAGLGEYVLEGRGKVLLTSV